MNTTIVTGTNPVVAAGHLVRVPEDRRIGQVTDGTTGSVLTEEPPDARRVCSGAVAQIYEFTPYVGKGLTDRAGLVVVEQI